MNLLAIETATEACSVALVVDGRRIERTETGARIHARVLVPWIESILAEAGLGYSALDAVAVDRGPGGFTSLRLGLGVAQGVALAHGLPVRPVSSLAATALEAWWSSGAGHVQVALDARMGEVYAGWFEFGTDPRPRPVGAEWLGAPDRIEARFEGAFQGAGSGYSVHADALRAALGASVASTLPAAMPTARAVAALAGGAEPVAAHELEPVYLRDNVTG